MRAPRELIEDACPTAWAILLRRQPERGAVFPWLRVVAIHEAYRLSAIDRRDARLERLRPDDGAWHEVLADSRSLDDALQALSALASLPARRRIDLALKAAGYRCEEIRAANARTHADQREQVARESPGSHPADAAAPRPVIAGASRVLQRKGANRNLLPVPWVGSCDRYDQRHFRPPARGWQHSGVPSRHCPR